MTSADQRPLRAGDVVEVRSAAEILATLDRWRRCREDAVHAGDGSVTRAGATRYRAVWKRSATRSRALEAAACRILFFLRISAAMGQATAAASKAAGSTGSEAWLRRVDGQSVARDASTEAAAKLEHLAQAGTHTMREIKGKTTEVWRCQVTESFVASSPLPTSNLSQYWRELTNGNFSLLRFDLHCAPRIYPSRSGAVSA